MIMTKAIKTNVQKSKKAIEYATKRATHLSTLIYLNNVDGLFKEIDILTISINNQKLTPIAFGLRPEAIEETCTSYLQTSSLTLTNLNLVSGLDPP